MSDRYGNRSIARMYNDITKHRAAVRSEGTPAIQETWDRVEEFVDYVFKRDMQKGGGE